ncbi:MAG: aldehyde ferredoxin oxidoreductase C-terminal domain-containing protein [Desulfovibrionaceae bacterium]
MMRDHFRVLVADLSSGRSRVELLDGRDQVAGGSGLAALLFGRYGHADRPWDDPDQPFILAVGPLTGLFPLMSKAVAAFKSPYHDQYAESHAGGRSALAIAFAGYDALVVVGRARRLTVLAVGSRRVEIKDVHYFQGADALAGGKALRRMYPGSGHRSIMRIGEAGERGSAMACINVDTYRHFGRLGGGAAMGAKNLKAVVVLGDGEFPAPPGKDYAKLYAAIHHQLTDTRMMSKYHDLGTAGNVLALNELKSLPWRNLQASTDPEADKISGERFGDDVLLRNMACAGCPVGCVHVGFVRERFSEEHRYLYRQVSYDYELIFAEGSMLGVTDPFHALGIMDEIEKAGLDAMGAGVALAWATEALEKGVVGEAETGEALAFGDAAAYRRAVWRLARGENEFWRTLGDGVERAVARYGGGDFSCVLGQEMAGYATGEVFFAAQSMGFRHSHLDSGAYSYDQKHQEHDAAKAVGYLVEDERARALLTCMVSCLFARGVYKDELLAEALGCVGYGGLAGDLAGLGERVQRLRWRTRFATGYAPESVRIPKRFLEVTTWKGPVDVGYLEELRGLYAAHIRELAAPAEPAGGGEAGPGAEPGAKAGGAAGGIPGAGAGGAGPEVAGGSPATPATPESGPAGS